MTERPSRVQSVRETLRRLKPFIGSKAEDILHAYLQEDAEGKVQIESFLEAWMAERASVDLDSEASLVPPSAEASQGPYTLGHVVYEGQRLGEFGLRESEWIQHVGIFGRTGAGKTNMGFLTLRELIRHKKPFLVLDWKRNYRDLVALPDFKDVEIYTIGRPIAPLAFNPLIPPEGTPPKTWLKKIIEVIAHAYMLGNGVLYLLQQTLDAVFEKFGIYAGTVERFPTFHDVLDELKRYPAKGRELGWLSSTLRALSALCFGDMETAVNRGQNSHLQELLKQPVILELDALAQSDKIFFIQAFLLWIHHFRMQEGFREKFKHAILIEEAHHVLSGERRSLIGGQSVMEITFREIREFGESLIILDQHPSQISLPALGNTYTTICLNLKHGKDVSAMAQAMLLEASEKDILGSLEIGQAVVKLQARVSKPFLIQIPAFNIRKGTLSDAEVAERPRTLMPSLAPYAPIDSSSQRLSNSRVSQPNPLTPGTLLPSSPQQAQASHQFPSRSPQPHEAHDADNAANSQNSLDFQFLQDIATFSDSGIARRYQRLGISVRQGQKLKMRLLSDGLITETLAKTDKGILRVVRITDQGRLLLKKPSPASEDFSSGPLDKSH